MATPKIDVHEFDKLELRIKQLVHEHKVRRVRHIFLALFIIILKIYRPVLSFFPFSLSHQDELNKMWQALDCNGNGIVSLAEVDRWIVEQFPLLNHKPALMRAFITTTKREGDGDDWVERHEFVTVRGLHAQGAMYLYVC